MDLQEYDYGNLILILFFFVLEANKSCVISEKKLFSFEHLKFLS